MTFETFDVSVMRGHDLTNKETMTKTNTKKKTMTKTNTFSEHLQGAILETFDLDLTKKLKMTKTMRNTFSESKYKDKDKYIESAFKERS